MVVVVVAAAAVVDRGVRSAGNRLFGLSDHWGRSDAAPVVSRAMVL